MFGIHALARQKYHDEMSASEPISPELERLPRSLFHVKWVFAAMAVSITGYFALQVALISRQRTAIREIEYFNGTVQCLHPRGPEWLRQWIGEEWMECVDEPEHVVFWADEATLSRRSRRGGVIINTTGPLIDDAALACVLGLPNLKSLDLAFSNTSDAGIRVVCRLQNLEKLRLEGTDVSDLSIPILSQMRGLKELNVEHTQVTIAGGRELEAALPDCDVRGPHNDAWEMFLRR